MEKWFTVFEYAVSVFEGCILVGFVHNYCGRKLPPKSDQIVLRLYQVLFSLAIILLNLFVSFEGAGIFAFAVLLLVYARIALDGTFVQQLFASVFAILCTVLTAGPIMPIAASIAGMPLNDIYASPSIVRCIGVCATKVLEWALLRFVASSGNKRGRVLLTGAEWCQVIFVSGLSVYLIAEALNLQLTELSKVNPLVNGSVVVLIAGILLFNLYYIYIVLKKDRYNRIETENSLLKQQNIFQAKYAENIQEQYQSIRTIKHDMKNLLSAAEVLIRNGNTEEACALLQTQAGALAQMGTFIETENETLNAIVNYKMAQAKQKGVRTSCIVSDSCKDIPALDLCNLLGNLLDNAIEATEKIESDNRQIDLQITRTDNKRIIFVRNTVASPVLDGNKELKTTKADAKHHGIGMQTVREIAEKQNGFLDIFEEDGFFCVKIAFLG